MGPGLSNKLSGSAAMAKGAREVQLSLMTILLDLADYDGNRVAVLEAIKRSRKPGPDVMAELVALAGADDPNVATGATWLLRAYVEDGTPLESDLVSSLALTLVGIDAPWARLHICQTVRSLSVPDRDAENFAAFLRRCVGSERPFVRAWATDGLHHLARQHDSYETEARAVLEAALTDRAASVRARARRILAECE